MDKVDLMESELKKALIPRAMSDEGLRSLEALIDDLASESGTCDSQLQWWVAGAACLVTAAAGWWTLSGGAGRPIHHFALPAEPAAVAEEGREIDDGIRLVSESRGVVSAESDGRMIFQDDGSLLEAWHVEVVGEEFFHDSETGHEVRVVRPQEEWVLLPVNSF